MDNILESEWILICKNSFLLNEMAMLLIRIYNMKDSLFFSCVNAIGYSRDTCCARKNTKTLRKENMKNKRALLYTAEPSSRITHESTSTARSAFWNNSWVVGKIHGCVNNNLACMQYASWCCREKTSRCK